MRRFVLGPGDAVSPVPTNLRPPPRGASPTSPRTTQVSRGVANVVGAAGAGWFAWSGYRHYEVTRSLIGAGFLGEQLWVVLAYLVRRPARRLSIRTSDWALAFAGTFGGVLFRPHGAHPHWGIVTGSLLQAVGLAVCVVSFATLGRSFGFAAADRGLKVAGPYAVVRHPLYASYVVMQLGYVLQSISWRNVMVMVVITGCNVGRARAEERLLTESSAYARYRQHVRWRLLPGLW
ncbi:MAG: isoprenylcysteine carboxylmethyltransferase family protein [Acidimicrobiaceae bacterium]|nr:isoprenylcysteine carboxylmethyltransferase family protein [Acidimicrobiaceae bacterium]